MQSIITIVHILAACALVGLVLIQHGKGADAGAAFGSGSAGSVFGARGPATFLTRATAVLAATFFVTSLSLAYLSSRVIERESIVERVQEEVSDVPAPADLPAPRESAGGEVPAAPERSDSPSDVPTVGEDRNPPE